MADVNKQLSKRRIFLQRAFSTVVLWLIIAGAIAFENIWLFFAIIGFLGLSALVEVLKLLPDDRTKTLPYAAFFIGLAYFAATFWHVQTQRHPDFYYLDLIAVVVSLFVLFFLALGRKPEGPQALWQVVGPFFAIVYVPILFSFVTRLIVLPANGIQTGAYYLLFLLVVTKFTDTGAYCVGSLIGRHKMIPRISPGKTWEGFAGALIFALVCGHGIVAFLPDRLAPITGGNVTFIALALAIVAVLGDLAESVVKRALRADDSGHVLPGIGGALDLIDSVLFTGPAFFLILRLLG